MQKRLFLIGPDRSGKSDIIRRALGADLSRAGGFHTLREWSAPDAPGCFCLTAADSSGPREKFLEFENGHPVTHLEVFSQLGTRLLRQAENRSFVLMDELGGVELLDDGFLQALLTLLRGNTPCIGVMKGEGPTGKVMDSMGLSLRGEIARRALYDYLTQDPDTLLLHTAGQDPQAVRQTVDAWVAEFVHNH